jgi:hypothetical protein
MNISQKLITLGLAFSLLSSTCAFARPIPHFRKWLSFVREKDDRESCSFSKSIRRDRLCVSSVS